MATGWPLPDEVAQVADSALRSSHISNFGLLFQRYLKYPREWEIKGDEKRRIWNQDIVGRSKIIYYVLGELQNALQERINFLAASLRDMGYNVETVPAEVAWRLSIGLGTASSLETGLTLHRIHGIPYLPGSAIKGVTRSYRFTQIAEAWSVPQLAPAEIKQLGDKKTPWDELETLLTVPKTQRKQQLENLRSRTQEIRQMFELSSSTEVPRSLEDVEPDIETFLGIFGSTNQQGDVIFLDALPISLLVREGNREESILELDIINSHYQDYYQGDQPPADWLSPNPVYFLTVRAGTQFRFCLAAKDSSLLGQAKDWLSQALQDCGIGAKTRAGYGELCPTNSHDTHKSVEQPESKSAVTQPEPPPPPMTMDELRASLEKQRPQVQQRPLQVGQKVQAEIIAIEGDEGDRITVRLIGAQNEEETFTQPHYPHDVGQEVQVKIRKLDKNGRITAVSP